LTSTEAEQQIKDHLASEPALATVKVNNKVKPQSVVLTGTVDTEAQHNLAVRIAKSHSGDRQVVDKIRVKQ
jgi:osmotically-inducible protein OsmY